VTEGAEEHERGGGINVRVAAWLARAFVALSVALFIASGVLYVLVLPRLSETPSCRESSSGSVVGVWQA
jgi:hypothetical protein